MIELMSITDSKTFKISGLENDSNQAIYSRPTLCIFEYSPPPKLSIIE